MAAATKRARTFTLADLIERQQRALVRGKKSYKLADALMQEIARQADPGQKIPLSNKRTAIIKDNWAGKMQVSTGAYCRRYEIEVSET